MSQNNKFDVLSKIYYDVDHEAGFGSINKLLKAGRLVDSQITRKDVEDFSKDSYVYTLHKSARRKYERNKVVVSHVDEQFMADLVDMQDDEFKKTNVDNSDKKPFAHILTCIDVLSKYAFAIPLKDKRAATIKQALEMIFQKRKPAKLMTDQGGEFWNSTIRNLCKEYGIHFFTSKNYTIKCSVVERFNRTLRSKMFKYFTYKGSFKYHDLLQRMVDSYNNTHHSAIGMKPSEVTHENEQIAFKNLYGFNSYRDYLLSQKKEPTLKEGENVRVKFLQEKIGSNSKGYWPLWADEVHKVIKVKSHAAHPYYKIKDGSGETVSRRFQKEGLQAISANPLFRIEKILRTRNSRHGKELRVKWIGYPSRFNQWIKESAVVSN